jgi:multidrug transporter EmrE-like cation transporter
MSAWLFVAAAIALEVTGTFLLKLSHGFANWHWGLLSIACYSGCFWALSPAMKVLPIGVIYAVWAGVGIVAAALLGLVIFWDGSSAVHRIGAGRRRRVATDDHQLTLDRVLLRQQITDRRRCHAGFAHCVTDLVEPLHHIARRE